MDIVNTVLGVKNSVKITPRENNNVRGKKEENNYPSKCPYGKRGNARSFYILAT
jgi:hypothetical protein